MLPVAPLQHVCERLVIAGVPIGAFSGLTIEMALLVQRRRGDIAEIGQRLRRGRKGGDRDDEAGEEGAKGQGKGPRRCCYYPEL